MNGFLPGDWQRARAARLPAESLSALAPLRDRDEIRVHLGEAECWVTWGESHFRVVALLLSAPGVEFAFEEKGQWFRVGSRLPLASGPPRQAGKRLSQVLIPQRFTAELPEVEPKPERFPLTLVRGGPPQRPTAIRCPLRDLLHWSEGATNFQLRSLRAAHSGDEVLLLGRDLPTVTGATRFWGDDLLIPVGCRVEPDLPPATVRSIFGTLDDEFLVIETTSAEKIRRELFQPLIRAGLREI
jgi:hypothetical protein